MTSFPDGDTALQPEQVVEEKVPQLDQKKSKPHWLAEAIRTAFWPKEDEKNVPMNKGRRLFLKGTGVGFLGLLVPDVYKSRPEASQNGPTETPAPEPTQEILPTNEFPLDILPPREYDFSPATLESKMAETRVIRAESFADLQAKLWEDTPHLFDRAQTLQSEQGPHFHDDFFLNRFRELRAQNHERVITGIIVVKQSDFESGIGDRIAERFPDADPVIVNYNLTQFQHHSFTLPFERQLANIRGKGVNIPSKVIVHIAVLPDEVLDQEIHFKDPNGGVTDIPTNFFEDGSSMAWPPGIDWVFYDTAPLTAGHFHLNDTLYGDGTSNVVVHGGLIHEQDHLNGPIDLYRHVADINDYLITTDGAIDRLRNHVQGWESYRVSGAYLAKQDIMHTLDSDSSRITLLSALQNAQARARGIRSTMYEGVFDPALPSLPYTIRFMSESGEDISPQSGMSFGIAARWDEYFEHGEESLRQAQENEQYRFKSVDLEGENMTELAGGFILGFTLSLPQGEFTLPVPSIIQWLPRLAFPNDESPPGLHVNFDVQVMDIQRHLEWWRENGNEENARLYIDVNFFTDEQFSVIQANQGGDAGVILAQADIVVDSSLFLPGESRPVKMVWLAKKERTS